MKVINKLKSEFSQKLNSNAVILFRQYLESKLFYARLESI